MDFDFSQAEKDFRAEVAEYIKPHLLPGVINVGHDGTRYVDTPERRKFMKALAERGLLGLSWPKEYGGKGMPFIYDYHLLEELCLAGAPQSVEVVKAHRGAVLAADAEDGWRPVGADRDAGDIAVVGGGLRQPATVAQVPLQQVAVFGAGDRDASADCEAAQATCASGYVVRVGGQQPPAVGEVPDEQLLVAERGDGVTVEHGIPVALVRPFQAQPAPLTVGDGDAEHRVSDERPRVYVIQTNRLDQGAKLVHLAHRPAQRFTSCPPRQPRPRLLATHLRSAFRRPAP